MSKSSSKKSVNISSLALSDWHLRIERLEAEHQWFLKQIKKKRTELNNFVSEMQTLAREMFAKGTPRMREMLELDQEIHKLFKAIFKEYKFNKSNRQKVNIVYENIQKLGIISPSASFDQDLDEDLDELFRNVENAQEEQNKNNYQQEFGQTEREEIAEKKGKSQDSSAREIRQTFLRLASIFHPDKVIDEESHLSHTEIMQEINRAYQEGDLARLLEIEQNYQMGAKIDVTNQDHLTRQCELLEERNNLLKNQYEDLKRELRLVKNTPEGEMVSDYRRAKREKVDIIAEMLKELDEKISIIREVRDFVRDFKERKISLKKFLIGPQGLRTKQEEIIKEILDQLYYEIMEDDFEFF